MSLSTILTGLETRAAAVFTGKTALKHVWNLDLNTAEGMKNHYGIKPLGRTQTEGVTKFVTADQDFEVILTDTFISVKRGDSAVIDKITALHILIDNFYKDLQETKAGTPSEVINVTNLSVDEAEVDIESNNVVVTASFTIRYRNNFS